MMMMMMMMMMTMLLIMMIVIITIVIILMIVIMMTIIMIMVMIMKIQNDNNKLYIDDNFGLSRKFLAMEAFLSFGKYLNFQSNNFHYNSEYSNFSYNLRQIWGIWKLRPAYSPETPNLGQNRWCFVPCNLEIWWMTLENNRASLLCCFKLCATFHSHRWIQTGVTVRKRPI